MLHCHLQGEGVVVDTEEKAKQHLNLAGIVLNLLEDNLFTGMVSGLRRRDQIQDGCMTP